MPNISAFRGIRYDLGHVGSLADVVAPPYDVIDANEQDELYKRHPANVVRLILNRDEQGDDEQANRYSRAAQFLRNWQREGVLFTEPDPAVYVYHQEFEIDGEPVVRRGFLAGIELERFGEGNIHPHEETHARAKEDRLKLWRACEANLSPIFGLFPDEANEAQRLLEMHVGDATPLEVTDGLGVLHRIWPVTDGEVITKLTAAMGGRPIFIADGHHRYETACAYRDEVAEKNGGSLPSGHPANSVLMTCVSMSDPGMVVLPTHRLFRGLPAIKSTALADKLSECFTIEKFGTGRLKAYDAWQQLAQEENQGTLAFYCGEDQEWLLARLNKTGAIRMAELEPDRSDEWRDLGVSILHRLVVDAILQGESLPAPKYVRSLDELVEGLEHGDAAGRDATGQAGSGGRFELAALVMPASLDHVRSICESGERMPAKSTFFYPKLLSGLVIKPLA